MIKPEAYIDFSKKDNELSFYDFGTPSEILDFSELVCNHVAYLISDLSRETPQDYFKTVPPPVMLSDIAYQKVLLAKKNVLDYININVLVFNPKGEYDIKRVNAKLIHIPN